MNINKSARVEVAQFGVKVGDQRDETEAYDWHCTPSNLHVSEEQRAVSVNHSTGTVAVVCRLLVVGFLSQSTNVVSFLSRSPLQQSGDGGWGGAWGGGVIRMWKAFIVYTDLNAYGCAGLLCACKHHFWNLFRAGNWVTGVHHWLVFLQQVLAQASQRVNRVVYLSICPSFTKSITQTESAADLTLMKLIYRHPGTELLFFLFPTTLFD